MKSKNKSRIQFALVMASILTTASVSDARGPGGGGARPSMGHVGGGGGRPSMGGGGRPPMSRPSPSHSGGGRPSMGNVSRPSPNVSRPNPSTRPNTGSFHPSGSSRPNTSLPSKKPGGAGGSSSRPSVKPPANVKPTTRPSLPSGGNNRPTTLPGNVAGGGNRPGAGGDRPSFGNINRPTTLPGIADGGGRPGGGTRPGGGAGNVTRPGGGGDRPGIGGGDRPNIGGGNRPGGGGAGQPNRPGGGDRPVIGGGGNRPNRPGGGNINIGNDINIGSGNGNFVGGGNNIGNRPNWDRPNWNNPGWGWGGAGNNWAGNWHNHCINGHHNWYNGCWHGYWGSSWYAPVGWVGLGWGLGAMTSGWGYGGAYYNPYYTQPEVVASVPYDYSQPVVINNYVTSDSNADGGTAQAQQNSPETDQSLNLFDDGLAEFKAGNYQPALAKFDAALKQLPKDPVVHEVRALTLFALGEYGASAAALNSMLSSAPGMDWTTMSSLYGDADQYTVQLRKLEKFCKANPDDAASHFVLAYHYLVVGSKDAAIKALKTVVKNQPKDTTAKRMLEALEPAQPAAPAPTPPTTSEASDAPETDLVGSWRAKAGETSIDLSITDGSDFSWKAAQTGNPALELKGQLVVRGDGIALETKDKGSMAGTVKSLGQDKWQFVLSGAPADDPGLTFERVTK